MSIRITSSPRPISHSLDGGLQGQHSSLNLLPRLLILFLGEVPYRLNVVSGNIALLSVAVELSKASALGNLEYPPKCALLRGMAGLLKLFGNWLR